MFFHVSNNFQYSFKVLPLSAMRSDGIINISVRAGGFRNHTRAMPNTYSKKHYRQIFDNSKPTSDNLGIKIFCTYSYKQLKSIDTTQELGMNLLIDFPYPPFVHGV